MHQPVSPRQDAREELPLLRPRCRRRGSTGPSGGRRTTSPAIGAPFSISASVTTNRSSGCGRRRRRLDRPRHADPAPAAQLARELARVAVDPRVVVHAVRRRPPCRPPPRLRPAGRCSLRDQSKSMPAIVGAAAVARLPCGPQQGGAHEEDAPHRRRLVGCTDRPRNPRRRCGFAGDLRHRRADRVGQPPRRGERTGARVRSDDDR